MNLVRCAPCRGVGLPGIVGGRDGRLEVVKPLRPAPCYGVGFPGVVDRRGKLELEVHRGWDGGTTRSTVDVAVRAWNVASWGRTSLAMVFHHNRVLLLLLWLLLRLL